MPTDAYVYVSSFPLGEELDFTRARGALIADAHARYRRAIGDDVVFAPALVGEDTDGRREQLQRRLDALQISLDWDRSASTADSDVARSAQVLFTKLIEAGLAYQRGQGWFLRMDSFNDENNRRVDELDGWSEAARTAQRELLHRVDGFDFEAKALDGTALSVFTGHPDSVADAEFVGLSTRHPALDRWLDDPGVRTSVEQLRSGNWAGKPLDEMPAVEVGMSVQVPSVAQPLPIVVSPAVDARFGTAAILGIPSADPVDKAMARSLPKSGGLAWKVESKPPKTTPAHRYLVDDMPLSTGGASGAAVPVVHCDACGAVPVAESDLPVDSPGGERECPACGKPAKLDGGRIHRRLTAPLLVPALPLPREARATGLFDGAELGRWLPASPAIVPSDAGLDLLDVRTVAKAIRQVGLGELAGGEPLGRTVAHASFTIDGVSMDEAIDRHGSDAVRLAVLNAAAAAKPFAGSPSALEQAAAFLKRVSDLGEARLGGAVTPDAGIDLDDGLRRRLAGWCDTAVQRIGENLERVEPHRATRNASELLERIEDFERRVEKHRGTVAGPDADATAVALLVLTRVLDPIAPSTASELIERAGATATAWPEPQHARTAA